MYKLILTATLLMAASVAASSERDEKCGVYKDARIAQEGRYDFATCEITEEGKRWLIEFEKQYAADKLAQREASELIEANKPKVRDEVMRTYTEPFPALIRLHDGTNPEKWQALYESRGAVKTRDIRWRGDGLVREVDEDGEVDKSVNEFLF